MIPRGQGHVINVASLAGETYIAGAATYCASKHAVVGFTDAARIEYRRAGVKFSMVLPTFVNTELIAGTSGAKGIKNAEPTDIADAIVKLVAHPKPRVRVTKTAGAIIASQKFMPARGRGGPEPRARRRACLHRRRRRREAQGLRSPGSRRRVTFAFSRRSSAARTIGGVSLETPTHAPVTLSDDELSLIDKYWRAANYLSVGQIYLLDNPLLTEPLAAEHVKPRLLGHWGTTPGLNLIYAHLNRIIRNRDANVIYVTGPGHGGPGLVANAYLEGTYSEVYTGIEEDAEGLRKLFRQFSFPGGIPSHVAAQTPGSIHEGGELGYALVHAYGAAFDNPDLVVACVIGDGEAETGPLAASWHSNKFLNPAVDGAVLPILQLNGYKIANPTVLARIPHAELESLLRGYGYRPITVAGDDPAVVHQQLAAALDDAFDDIAAIQRAARSGEHDRAAGVADDRAAHPQGLDRTESGRRQAGRGHLAGAPGAARRDARQPRAPRAAGRVAAQLSRPRSCSTGTARCAPSCGRWRPAGDRRMSANPHANGGLLLHELDLPDFRDYAVPVPQPATTRTRPPACWARSCGT